MLLVETTNKYYSQHKDRYCITLGVVLLLVIPSKQQYNTTKQTIQRQTNNSPQEIKEGVLQTTNQLILFLFCYFILLSSLVLPPILLGITGNTEVVVCLKRRVML